MNALKNLVAGAAVALGMASPALAQTLSTFRPSERSFARMRSLML